MARKGQKAWLLTWEGVHAELPRKVELVLDSRLSPERVAFITELLYWREIGSWPERLQWARQRHKWNPPMIQWGQLNSGIRYSGQMYIGMNPWLYARVVEELQFSRDEVDDGFDDGGLSWVEIPLPEVNT
ncbi:MAG: hypothetical protein KDH92_13555 [Chloroflexi bacterium]|nr:hypothetical protein [Chloroflexota bacterium]